MHFALFHPPGQRRTRGGHPPGASPSSSFTRRSFWHRNALLPCTHHLPRSVAEGAAPRRRFSIRHRPGAGSWATRRRRLPWRIHHRRLQMLPPTGQPGTTGLPRQRGCGRGGCRHVAATGIDSSSAGPWDCWWERRLWHPPRPPRPHGASTGDWPRTGSTAPSGQYCTNLSGPVVSRGPPRTSIRTPPAEGRRNWASTAGEAAAWTRRVLSVHYGPAASRAVRGLHPACQGDWDPGLPAPTSTR